MAYKQISKARPPKGLDGETQRVMNDIYRVLNNIIDSVNSGDVIAEKTETQGKSGDIRVIKSPENGEAHIEIRTDEGWYRSDTAAASGFSIKE